MATAAPSRHRIRALLLAAVLAAGCGEGPAHETPQRTARQTPGAPAARVVSLVPALTETVVALGAGETLVGLGRFDPPVPGRPDLPRLGDALSVSLEAVLALEPDAVLVNGVGLAERLAPIGDRTRVEVLPTDTLADVTASTTRLGDLLGRSGAAARLVATLERAVDEARYRSELRTEGPPRVLVVVQRRPIYTAGAGSYLHELLQAVGATNVAGDLDDAWPTLSDESLLARAPDVILDASVGDADTPAGRAALLAAWREHPTIPAVAEGRVHVLGAEGEPLFRAGPRLPAAIALLEQLLYGEGDER